MRERRDFFRKTLTLAGAAIVPGVVQAQEPARGSFVHMVFFWLRDSDEKAVTSFMTGMETFLKQVKEINRYHIGRPANTYREIVDRSYSVALMVEFDNQEMHDKYQVNPIHQKWANANKDLWHDIKIFDSQRPV